eukprot:gene9112-6403_t
MMANDNIALVADAHWRRGARIGVAKQKSAWYIDVSLVVVFYCFLFSSRCSCYWCRYSLFFLFIYLFSRRLRKRD